MAPHATPKLLPTGGLLLEASGRDLLYLPSTLHLRIPSLANTPSLPPAEQMPWYSLS